MAKPNQPRKINRYSAEFKLKAVRLTEIDGVQVKDIAEALDIHPYMLSRWRSEARKGLIKTRPQATPKLPSADDMRAFSKLRREHELLKREHDLLKKLIRFASTRKTTSSRSSPRRRTSSE